MRREDLEKIVLLRRNLVIAFEKLRDYKMNPNAIMKETDHAKILSETVVALDEILKNHVEFK